MSTSQRKAKPYSGPEYLSKVVTPPSKEVTSIVGDKGILQDSPVPQQTVPQPIEENPPAMHRLEYYECDPEGDVVLIVGDGSDENVDPDTEVKAHSELLNGVSAAEYASEGKIAGGSSDPVDDIDSNHNAPNADQAQVQYKIRVSSKHLALASPFFRTLFCGKFKEALSNDSDRSIALPGDDAQPFLILLNIVHGFTRRVPRQIDPLMLHRVLVLVDKYGLHEIAEVFTDMWFDAVRSRVPQSLSPDLFSWIFICFVLKKREAFKHLTKLAQEELAGPLEEDNLPLPLSIAERIEDGRLQTISGCISVLRRFLAAYEDPRSPQCLRNPHCDATVLGSLIRELKSVSLYPLPQSPYHGWRVNTLSESLRKLTLPSLCDIVKRGQMSIEAQKCGEGPLGLKPRMLETILKMKSQIRGIELDDTYGTS